MLKPSVTEVAALPYVLFVIPTLALYNDYHIRYAMMMTVLLLGWSLFLASLKWGHRLARLEPGYSRVTDDALNKLIDKERAKGKGN